MFTAKPKQDAIDYLYDPRRSSWIACYPNATFCRLPVAETRASTPGCSRDPEAWTCGRDISRTEFDISVGIVVLIQLISICYILLGLRA
jgi:hypothetical protein